MASTAQAHAVQISLSGDNIDRYFRILEHYVLPLMVVSTVVLFCGYVASRIYHRTVARSEGGRDDEAFIDDAPTAPYDGTAAFLRELRATPPIEDAEPKREPRMRAQHPLLRKRAANAAAALRARPRPEAPDPRQTAAAADAAAAASAFRLDLPQRPAERPQAERAPAPRLDAPLEFDLAERLEPEVAPRFREVGAPAPEPPREAPREPRDDAGEAESGRNWVESEEPLPEPGRRLGRAPFADSRLHGDRAEADRMEPDGMDEEPTEGPSGDDATDPRADPPPISTPLTWWQQDAAATARAEPSAAVVQSMKTSPAQAPHDLDAARTRAGELGDSLDYVTSVLQQGATLVAERMQAKQGLERDDVRSMRITGIDSPQEAEDLWMFGDEVAEEVRAAFGAVTKFDNALARLEQMAENEPLDEGWNDLLRSRVSDILYAVGQVRKTLDAYRPAAKKKPSKPSDKRARPGGAGGGPDRPVPVGRRQL